ncbi:E3 SUMO-protein ligase ZNF451 [Gadus chalcogrammus]|uniref:E3 SUMO-protein ligase ZNF451 n=1 Tax=Gadus chalcogrammus TaxID=1042646 RepID=UPI0024C4D05B|nr:E3 SUMO-protein ligase ZNF451 [Gadus chalcogrammus]XP_056465086.1 E3 SUMO-protein ligase ZNF451 [Gadus chalcogrammus]
MSSSMEEDEEADEEVQFVSEASHRPVLDFIDIPSDSDEDRGLSEVIEDKIERQKAQVNSTLDRLMRRVAAEKRERADKCKAFKEKQMSQRAHGRHELACAATERTDYDAKRCVDMWLKMPGVRPGVVNGGRGMGRPQRGSFPSGSTSKHTCPVVNCGKVFDNIPLIEGHLKRFDHSPCDPSIHLKGSPSNVFACVVCTRRFDTHGAWMLHLQSKVSSSDPGGHDMSQTCQTIVCFACPACYLLFSLRDECLQHMAAKKHYTHALGMIKDSKARALPVPIPSSAKSRLIDLCSGVDFNVRCSECRKVLTSHQEAQAHFNVCCRQGRAVSEAEKTVVQMMRRLLPRGQCSPCCELFLSQEALESHREATRHAVEVNPTAEMAVLQFCRFSEIQRARRAKERGGPSATPPQRKRADVGGHSAPAKRQRLDSAADGDAGAATTLAWVCECGLHFSQEAAAKTHLMAANEVFHLCGVCGKRMGDLSITRLHMCRFHGGAHLANFLYHCRRCKVDMPRYEDILSHVADAHGGHGYFVEREVPLERVVPDAKPSTSGTGGRSEAPAAPHPEPAPCPTWMCRMCEETFGTEAEVGRHCGDVANHSFQRFVCGHCPQKFFKESTVRRHCRGEHGGEPVAVAYFCGLCDSMRFEREEEFTEHYERLHSKDYYRVDDHGGGGSAAGGARSGEHGGGGGGDDAPGPCPCMGSEKGDDERKALFTRCVKKLSAEGRCRYVCAPCAVTVASFARIKTHVATTHPGLNLAKTFDVVCSACLETFESVPTFHEHFHSEHCLLAPCRGRGRSEASTPDSIPDALEVNPDLKGAGDVILAKVLRMDEGAKDGAAQEGDSDEELIHALALSEAEAKPSTGEADVDLEQALAISVSQTRASPDLEEALQRSLLEF